MILEDSWEMPPEKRGRRGVSDADDEDDDYRRKRDRNNEDSWEMPPEKRGRRGVSDADDEDDDYRRKRDRNNEAVKKSRFKSKQRTQETFTRVNKLKAENQALEEKVKSLTKDLEFLKKLFMDFAAKPDSHLKIDGIDLEKLLADVPDDDKGSSSKS